MRPAHAGVRAAEGGGHVFFSHRCVCVSVRACTCASTAWKGRGCRYFVSVVTLREEMRSKRKEQIDP